MGKFTIRKSLLIIMLAFVSLTMSAQVADTVASANDTLVSVSEEADTMMPQKKEFKSYMFVTAELGANAITRQVNEIRPGFEGHIGLGWQFTKLLSLKATVGAGLLRGVQTGTPDFKITKGNYLEANLSLGLSFLDLVAGYNPNRKVSLTPYVGIGAFQYRMTTESADGTRTRIGYKPLLNAGTDVVVPGHGWKYRRAVMEVPVGVEIGFNVAPKWNVYIDASATWLNKDFVCSQTENKKGTWMPALNVGTKYSIIRGEGYAEKKYCSNWFVGAEVGAFYALGDQRKFGMFKDAKGNVAANVGYQWGRAYKVYGELAYAAFGQRVRANSDNEFIFDCTWGSQFSGDINIAMDLINMISYKQDRIFALYLHAGLGLVQYRSKGTYLIDFSDSHKSYLAGDNVTFGYGQIEDDYYNTSGRGFDGRRCVGYIPVGAEASFKVSEHFDIYVDGTVQFYDSDLVNGIESGRWNDWSLATNVGLRYKFAKKCPIIPVDEDIEPVLIPDTVYIDTCFQEPIIEEPDSIEKPVMFHVESFTLYFEINKADLNTPRNKSTLDAFFASVGDRIIKGINIIGYASPDGPKKFNEELSLKRAAVAKEYIEQQLGDKLNGIEITMSAAGPDFEGFLNYIANSDLKDRDIIVDRINKSDNKPYTLRKLQETYPELKEIYKPFRRSEVKVEISFVEE